LNIFFCEEYNSIPQLKEIWNVIGLVPNKAEKINNLISSDLLTDVSMIDSKDCQANFVGPPLFLCRR
jgi:hypothetical protein